MTPTIVKAVVQVKLPIICAWCGSETTTEPITIEVENTTPLMLSLAIQRQKVGTHFPVGWGTYQRRDELNRPMEGIDYKCPKCHE